MKKFRIIFTDSKTGLDLYDNVMVQAAAMSVVAVYLERRGATFRLIEEVTAQYASHYCARDLTSGEEFIPKRAFSV